MSSADSTMRPDEGATRSQDVPSERRDLRQRVVLALLLGGFGCLFLLNCWSRDFWAPEEVDFAQACLEMHASGVWLDPTISGQPYHEKPILIYLLALASQALTGLDPHIAYRLPGALFGVLGLWVAYSVGRAFFSRNVGVLAMLIQGTTFTYFRTSSWLLTDVVFTSLISLSTLAFTVRIVWARYSARWLAVGYGALALACLAKSPLLAPFFVGATVLVFLVLQYGLRRIGSELRQLQIPIGLAAVLAVVLPWYVIMVVRHGGSFLSVSFLDQHFGRLMGAESHQRPIWYYLRSLPGDFLPWSFFLPLAIFYGHARFSRPAEKVLMVWALVVFVALTLVSSKQGKYLLPMWTPLAVLVAAGFMDAEPESIWETYLGAGVLRVFPWLLRGLALVGLVAAACIWTDMIPERLRQAPRDALFASQGFQVRFLVTVGLTAAGLFSGAWFTARELRKRETLRALYGVSASLAFLFAAGTFLYGDLNTVKSGRNFATVVKETTGGQPLAIYAARRPGLLVYMIERTVPVLELLDSTGENPEPKASMARYIESPEERFLLIDQDYRKKFEGDFPSLAHKLRPVASGHVGSRRVYWLLSNRVQ